MKPRPDTNVPRPGCGSVRSDEVLTLREFGRRLNLAERALADAHAAGCGRSCSGGSSMSWAAMPWTGSAVWLTTRAVTTAAATGREGRRHDDQSQQERPYRRGRAELAVPLAAGRNSFRP